MILPGERDETLEWAARRIEEPGFLSDQVALPVRLKGERRTSRRMQRAREDAALIEEITRQVRARCAADLRAFLARPELSALAVLETIAGLGEDRRHDVYLRDAWPLAWSGKGWVHIDCIIRCDSNVIPPETEYRIRLTDRGRQALEDHRAKQQQDAHHHL
jgi:hypothetical protein